MYNILTVYHGGTDTIEHPKVDIGRPDLDFGPGFYISDIYTQATSWARRIAADRAKAPVVNTYHLHRGEFLTHGKCKVFPAYDKEWLDFITASRMGQKPWIGYDYIEGGVADDRVIDTVRLYINGFYSAEYALGRLRYFKPANQICILNQTLLDRHLTFINSEILSDNER